MLAVRSSSNIYKTVELLVLL